MRKAFHILVIFLLAASSLRAQDTAKDRVRLVSAQSAQLVDKDGESYRKVVGPAKFFHNNTWLLCDTALWNVKTNIIDAVGHVRIIQDRTRLTSATLQYVVDEDMAKFRGDLVQLEDEDKNTLRTRYLDYNTKDSVAIFQNGAAMRDKDGQVIESQYGTYDSKARLFVFNENVNMYLDTTFVKTSRLEYRTDLSTAYFGFGTDMWQDDKMLSAGDGRYERDNELFFFRRNVHILTEDQEAWADSMYYHRALGDAEMLGKVELMDSTRNVFALAGRFQYTDSLSQILMTRDPAIMSITEEKGTVDTLYVGGDILRFRAIPKCDIPEGTVNSSSERLKSLSGDPIAEYRKKAAEAAAKAAEEAAKNDPNRPPTPPPPTKPSTEIKKTPVAPPPAPDSTAVTPAMDTTAVAPAMDTTAVAPPEPPKDSTKVNFLWGSGNVKMFRKDMQMASDSLAYTDLDSLVRLYRDPVFYNEGNRQYAADSIMMVIKNKRAQKAHLLSNAFITIQEDKVSYDQIRAAEMVAYFDSTSALTRFDALGGSASIFYLVENNALATVNKVESKMIYALFKDGSIERIYYYDSPKNDGYPSVQMPEDEKQLKGFRWEPEKRPSSPLDVTALTPRGSQRTSYLARPHAVFTHTETYFPGYIRQVYRDIAIRDSLKVVRSREAQRIKDSTDRAAADSLLLAAADTTIKAAADTLQTPVAAKDTTTAAAVAAPADSTATAAAPPQPDPKALKAAEKARKKAERQAAREARWAEEDRIYAEKQAAKAARKLEKQRARKLKALRRLEKKARKEQQLLEKYIKKEQTRKNKNL